jgi:CheY-like chemotaxis protein
MWRNSKSFRERDLFSEPQKLRVLIAEDNRVNQLVLHKMLSKYGLNAAIVYTTIKYVSRML